jgi:hypothetical protein
MMTDEERNIHKKLAVDCFNSTWELIDKTDRNQDDDYRMILLAQASRYHWGQVGTPLEFQRGDWMISWVYSILGHKEEAMFAAKLCLDTCERENFGGFDIAFAHLAMARALRVNGDERNFYVHMGTAMEKARQIENEEDRVYTISEIEKLM